MFLSILRLCCRRAFLLEPVDGRTQPSFQGLLQLKLIVPQRVRGLTRWVQRNMVTWHVFTLGILGNEVGEEAFVARLRPRRLAEIDAGERILENPSGRLGSTHRTSITSLLQEGKFELKNFKNVALVTGHGTPPPGTLQNGNRTHCASSGPPAL